MPKLYKIGLTGGIGSGKSKLLNYLGTTENRIYTINLDLIGHQVYKLNSLIMKNVRNIFGRECV